MYQASKSSSSSASSRSTTASSSSSSSSSMYATPVASSTSQRAPSNWNQFQRDNAGNGLSRAEMASQYRSTTTADTTRGSAIPSMSSPPPPPVAATTSSTTATSSSSRSSGQGLSQNPSDSAAIKRAEAANAAARRAASAKSAAQRTAAAPSKTAGDTTRTRKTPQSNPTAMPTTTTAISSSSTAATSPWNQFQRQYAGKGLTKRQVSLLYQQSAVQGSSVPRSSGTTRNSTTMRTTATSSTRSTTVSPPRARNAFNEFQKQYKANHPHEKLSAAKLATLYRQQQHDQQRQAHETRFLSQLGSHDDEVTDHEWSNAMDELVAERRQELEQLMVEIAQRQEQLHRQQQQDTTSAYTHDNDDDEYDEWARLAQQLEAEEANLNRKAYVTSHEELLVVALSLENPQQHARHAKSLRECEVIALSRLQLSLDDDRSRIGSGGFAAVYAGVLDDLVPVAVKIVDGVSATAKDRFEQELLAMMRASAHTNVLRVFGYTTLRDANGRQSFGIVMELMGGGDLAFALHRDESVTLTLHDRLRVLVQVADAIEYIHTQGVTHRDIKPHNILLSSDLQTAKLADFGLAGVKNTTLTTAKTTVRGAMGLTPAYAAPEVMDGKLAFHDTAAWMKSDVFSFTVLVTQVLLGEQPWEFESPAFIANQVTRQHKRPFAMADLAEVLSCEAADEELQLLVQDGWHYDPQRRPTATQMRQRLEQIIAIVESAYEQSAMLTTTATTAKRSFTTTTSVSSPRSVGDSSAFYRQLYGERATTAQSTVYDGDEFFDAS